MGPQVHQPPPSAPGHPQLPKCSAFPADALKIHGPYGNSLAVQWLGAFTSSPGSLVRELRALMTYRQTKPRWPWSKPAAPATLTALARGSTSLPGQGKSTHQRVSKGALPLPPGAPTTTFRPWESRRQPGVEGYFWVWRGRGTVRGTGNWGAGVGKPKEFFQLPSPMLQGTPGP